MLIYEILRQSLTILAVHSILYNNQDHKLSNYVYYMIRCLIFVENNALWNCLWNVQDCSRYIHFVRLMLVWFQDLMLHFKGFASFLKISLIYTIFTSALVQVICLNIRMICRTPSWLLGRTAGYCLAAIVPSTYLLMSCFFFVIWLAIRTNRRITCDRPELVKRGVRAVDRWQVWQVASPEKRFSLDILLLARTLR